MAPKELLICYLFLSRDLFHFNIEISLVQILLYFSLLYMIIWRLDLFQVCQLQDFTTKCHNSEIVLFYQRSSAVLKQGLSTEHEWKILG